MGNVCFSKHKGLPDDFFVFGFLVFFFLLNLNIVLFDMN